MLRHRRIMSSLVITSLFGSVPFLACDSLTAPEEVVSGQTLSTASRASSYTVTDLGTLGGSYSGATGISARGHVVGYSETSSGDTHAFQWAEGIMSDLGTLGGRYSQAHAINARGQVVGSSETSGGWHAFLWQDEMMRDLGTLGGLQSFALGVNERGHVVGSSDTDVGHRHPFLWKDGLMTDLGHLGGHDGEARDINNRGQIVGRSLTAGGAYHHAFLWDNGTLTDLGTLGGGYSEATAINDRGQVVGSSETTHSGVHAFLWEKGVMTDLGPLGFATVAGGINARGQVAGALDTGGGWDAVAWQKGAMTTLGSPGIASSINDRGQVVGQRRTSAGGWQAALWMRTSTPSADVDPPVFGTLTAVPYSPTTQATAVLQVIGGTILDASEIAVADVSVFDAVDSVCGNGDDTLLSVAAGEIDRNSIDVTNGTGSITYYEGFFINRPGTRRVDYCMRVFAADGARPPNSDVLWVMFYIDWI